MIGNFVRSNNKNISSKISSSISQIPKNVPCKVDKVNDDMTVDLISLIDDSPFYNISIFLPIGISFDFKRMKYGILYYVNYDFSSLMITGKLNFEIESSQTQYGIFVPVLDINSFKPYSDFSKNNNELTIFNKNADNYISLETDNIIVNNKDKSYITMEDGVVTIKNNNEIESIVMDNKIEITSKQDVVKLQDGISLNSSAPIDISTQISSLKEIVDGLIECINLSSIPTSTAPGTPATPNPGLSTKIVELQTKLSGVLK